MCNPDFVVKVSSAVPVAPQYRFSNPVDWTVVKGLNWAVTGPNGAGKSVLADILLGRLALRQGVVERSADGLSGEMLPVGCISFRDIYSLADCREMYYQQRWNSSDEELSPLAGELFNGIRCEGDIWGPYLKETVTPLLSRRLTSLSSGELRKLLVARVLASSPRLLVMDNPFIGLDSVSREQLSDMLGCISSTGALQCVLVVSDPADIPSWVDMVMPVKDMSCLSPVSRTDFMADERLQAELFDRPDEKSADLPGSLGQNGKDFDMAVKMNGVTVKYGSRTILDSVDWRVRRGEKWALLGGNGSGKSTLLSLICGDNPQAYANDITLFDCPRGSGESIWDIKRRIGYVSPEMHTYYMEDIPCMDVAASGFFDSIGLFRKCNEEQRAAARKWMDVFGAGDIAERSFLKVSYGQQRLVLLVRAFVKNPDLLILDEPFHGLDAGKKALAGRIVEAYARQEDKTLIFVSHYDSEIPSCVDKRKVLSKPSGVRTSAAL